MSDSSEKRTYWSGQLVFILAAAGSAVGLGNLWKFPHIAWENGGGAFVFIYIACVILVGLPVMISEIVIGKLSKKDSFGAFYELGGPKSPFRFLGALGIVSSFVLLSYYAVITGWSLEYQMRSLQNDFASVKLSEVYKIISDKDQPQQGFSKDSPDSVKLEAINQKILATDEGVAMKIKLKVFQASLEPAVKTDQSSRKSLIRNKSSKKITHKEKRDLLKDTGISFTRKKIDIYENDEFEFEKLGLKESTKKIKLKADSLFEKHRSELIPRLQKNQKDKDAAKFKKWCNHFYKKRMKEPHFKDWLQRAFLPIYSSFSFQEFIGDPGRMGLWHSIVMVILCLISFGGIRKGIERVSKYGMVVLFIILAGLMINSLIIDKSHQGLKFLVFGQPEKLGFKSLVEALGHSFFTLSIGLGVMVTYGSYLRKESPTVKNAVLISGLDTLMSLVACLIIFPIIFVQGMNPVEGGIGILFTAVPLEFFKFSGGQYVSIVFYILIFLAALTSAISLLEVLVTFLQDEFNMKRFSASSTASTAVYLAGIPSVFSMGFFEAADTITSNVLLPLGGFIIAIFIGYKINMELIKKDFLETGSSLKVFHLFRFSMRYVSPLLVGSILGKLVYDLMI